MNIEQQRASFEAWLGFSPMKMDDGNYADPDVCVDWQVWQAALQSPEVQALRKDAERLDWIQEQAKESRSGVGFDWRPAYAEGGRVIEMKGWRFMRHHFLGDRKPNIREAIDAAMEKQP